MGYPNQEEIKNYERGICLETKRMLLQDLVWEETGMGKAACVMALQV